MAQNLRKTLHLKKRACRTAEKKSLGLIGGGSLDPHKKALFVKGARQIGKTTLVREFACGNHACFAELNFLGDEAARTVFAGPNSADALIENMIAHLRQPPEPGNMLILLGEA